MNSATDFNADTKTECSKCLGRGVIRAFRHIHGGDCFQCGGTGRGSRLRPRETPAGSDALYWTGTLAGVPVTVWLAGGLVVVAPPANEDERFVGEGHILLDRFEWERGRVVVLRGKPGPDVFAALAAKNRNGRAA